MIGSIEDSSRYQPSIILHKQQDINQRNMGKVMDLPTRLHTQKQIGGHHRWQGRLLATSVLGERYEAEKASSVTWPFKKQLVVDGYLCSSKYVDEEGQCTFDRRSIVSVVLDSERSDKSQTSSDIKEETTKHIDSSVALDGHCVNEGRPILSDDTPSSKECPICKYMKAGPCKDSFLAMEACMDKVSTSSESQQVNDSTITSDVSSESEQGSSSRKMVCLQETIQLFACMRESEYYDIMTANIGSKYDQMVEATSNVTEASSFPGKQDANDGTVVNPTNLVEPSTIPADE